MTKQTNPYQAPLRDESEEPLSQEEFYKLMSWKSPVVELLVSMFLMALFMAFGAAVGILVYAS